MCAQHREQKQAGRRIEPSTAASSTDRLSLGAAETSTHSSAAQQQMEHQSGMLGLPGAQQQRDQPHLLGAAEGATTPAAHSAAAAYVYHVRITPKASTNDQLLLLLFCSIGTFVREHLLSQEPYQPTFLCKPSVRRCEQEIAQQCSVAVYM